MEPSFLLPSEMRLHARKGSALIPILILFLMSSTLALLLLNPLTPVAHAAKSNNTGAYIDGVRFIQYLDDNVALEELKSGNLDTYYFRIPLEAASEIKNIPNLKEYDKLSGSFGLLLNPAPSNDSGSLNWFLLRTVR